jgi:hypothetical protein
MSNREHHTFAATLARAGRIDPDDVKRLRRDFLPDGISSREEAELLLRVDHSAKGWIPPSPGSSLPWWSLWSGPHARPATPILIRQTGFGACSWGVVVRPERASPLPARLSAKHRTSMRPCSR